MRASHPAADLLPLMTEEEFSALVSDITENGLREPIWIDKRGLVLDGRNRLRACAEAGAIPSFRTYEGPDPIGFVVSLNLRRRDLNPSQRAVIALDIETMYADEARKRMARAGASAAPGRAAEKGVASSPHLSAVSTMVDNDDGKARDKAGRAAGVSGRQVSRAKQVKDKAPDLIPAVTSGALSLSKATKEVEKRERALRPPSAFEEAAARVSESDIGYRARVSTEIAKTSLLLSIDPERAAAVCLVDDREHRSHWCQRVRAWVDAYESGLTTTTLRSVK